MVSEAFIQELSFIVGRSNVSVTRTGLELYSYDASQAQANPGVVVFPADTKQISRIVKTANKAGVDFIPRGFGTNLSGGTLSLTQGLVICMARLNKILTIEPESRYAVVQPGVTNLEVQQALSEFGAFYAPDPASQKVATLGGNAGENSGGPRCLKYGVTTNHILGMEVVMADGEILRIGGPALDPPGLDLRGVMVGSEGGFAIITELTLRTLPKTQAVMTMLAVYDSILDAAQSVSDIISAGIVPNTLEMMDALVIEAVEANSPCGYPADAAAVLIIEVEGMQVGLKEQVERIEAICMETNCRTIQTAKNQADRDRLWQGRRGAFGAMARLAPNYLVNDTCVPRTLLPEALRRVKTIADTHGCRVGNVFHAGDGNLHPLLLYDSRKPDEVKNVHKAGWDIMTACVELGGTISGEHGIGSEKQGAMRMVFSAQDLNTQLKLKAAMDPDNRLNPNKVIPLADAQDRSLSSDSPTVLKRPGGALARGTADVMGMIKTVHKQGKQVAAAGAGVFGTYGNTGSKEVVRVSTLGMNDIIEYDAANQFITAGAGLSLKALQNILGEKNQWLPVRPPFFSDASTIGALAAMGSSGPERFIYGAPRDLALGLQYIDCQGRVIAAGGKVVKNVAGYDMTRLLIGSHGVLGVISEVTWRVSTRPESCWAATADGDLNTCFNAALKFMNSNLSPVFITLFPCAAESKDGPDHLMDYSSGQFPDHLPEACRIAVGFEGLSVVVEHQVEQACRMFEENHLTGIDAKGYDLIDGCFKDQFTAMNKNRFVLKASAAAGQMPEIYHSINTRGVTSGWFIDFGCGRIFSGLDILETGSLESMARDIMVCQGYVQLEKSPESFGQRGFGSESTDCESLWRPEWQIMHRIKQALDPASTFVSSSLPGFEAAVNGRVKS